MRILSGEKPAMHKFVASLWFTESLEQAKMHVLLLLKYASNHAYSLLPKRGVVQVEISLRS